MISCAISRLVILCFGTLYPAYASYKAVKTKNVKEYVKWMMYWIVFALFSCAETFTDVFLAFWFPFYYEIKIILVLWLLSPATKGSSFLYRKFVHPQLAKREKDIDEYLARAKEQGYHAVLQLGTKGINYASQVLVQTALKGGGQIVHRLNRSYSMTDVHSPACLVAANHDEGETSATRRFFFFLRQTFLFLTNIDQADTATEEDSLPLDDFSDQQSFPSFGKLDSKSEVNSAAQYRRSPRSNSATDVLTVPTTVSDEDRKLRHTSAKNKTKRTRSSASSNDSEFPLEIRRSATLPRANRRTGISKRQKSTVTLG